MAPRITLRFGSAIGKGSPGVISNAPTSWEQSHYVEVIVFLARAHKLSGQTLIQSPIQTTFRTYKTGGSL